eukprot:scaffold243440_cov27-Prasinocladus_malaysianus.AAC.2
MNEYEMNGDEMKDMASNELIDTQYKERDGTCKDGHRYGRMVLRPPAMFSRNERQLATIRMQNMAIHEIHVPK